MGWAIAGFTLIPELLAFGYSHLNFDATILEVHSRGDDGESLLLDAGVEFQDLSSMHEELAGAQGVVIELRAGSVGSDVRVEQEQLSVLDESVGVLEVCLAGADGFYLGPAQGDAGFVTFK